MAEIDELSIVVKTQEDPAIKGLDKVISKLKEVSDAIEASGLKNIKIKTSGGGSGKGGGSNTNADKELKTEEDKTHEVYKQIKALEKLQKEKEFIAKWDKEHNTFLLDSITAPKELSDIAPAYKYMLDDVKSDLSDLAPADMKYMLEDVKSELSDLAPADMKYMLDDIKSDLSDMAPADLKYMLDDVKSDLMDIAPSDMNPWAKSFLDAGSLEEKIRVLQDLDAAFNMRNMEYFTHQLNGVSEKSEEYNEIVRNMVQELNDMNLPFKQVTQAMRDMTAEFDRNQANADSIGMWGDKASLIPPPQAESVVQQTVEAEMHTSALASLWERVQNGIAGAGERLQPVVQGLGNMARNAALRFFMTKNPFAQLGSSFKNIASSVKGLFASFKRIAISRAIRAVIKQISEGFTEGVNNVYQWAKNVGNPFADSMDRMATSLQWFKNSIGAAVAPLYNALAPLLDSITAKAVAVVNAINQIFSVLTGKTTWIRAKKQATEYADAMGGVSGAAEQAKLTLASFDELHLLDDPNSSSGSGGASGTDYGGMFEEVPVDFGNSFFERLKQAVSEGDWGGVGTLLGERFNEMLNSVGWVAIGDNIAKNMNNAISLGLNFMRTAKWTQVGADFATVLNKLVTDVHWEDLGRYLAEKINVWILSAWGFVTNFRWFDAGVSIGDIVYGWITEIKWLELLGAIVIGLLGLFQGLIGAIWGFMSNLWRDVSGFLVELWGKFSKWIGEKWSAVKNWISEAKQAIGNAFVQVGKTIKQKAEEILAPLRNIWQKVSGWWNDIASWLGLARNAESEMNGYHSQYGGRGGGGNVGTYRAEGGFVQSGEVFVARENGLPELVGAFGHSTAVANNDQIVAGIEAGVYRAMARAQGGQSQTIVISIDGQKVGEAVVGYNNDIVSRTGVSPLIY